MTKTRALTEHPFTCNFDPQVRERLASVAGLRRLEKDELLIREGSPAEHFFLLIHGHAEVELHVKGHMRRLQTLGPGDAAGWSWALPPYRSAFDVRAREPMLTLDFPAESLRQLCQDEPELGLQMTQQLLATLAERLGQARLQVLNLYER